MSRLSWAPPSTLPPLYAGWMASALGGPIAAETDATCEDCAMCAGPQNRPQAGLFFSPETKCCTYMPALPNFLVGRILRDGDPVFAAGRATVEARLAARLEVSPLGLEPTAVRALLYGHSVEGTFGQSRVLRCPHYLDEQGGRCGIWRHRNGVCATWFCKHVRGAVGLRFWRGLEQLLTAVEWQLVRWSVLELGVEADTLHELFRRAASRSKSGGALDVHQIDGEVDEAAYRRRWGSWAGQERKFFEECARLVDGLAWPDVLRIGGAEVALLERLARDAYRHLTSDVIPERLQVGKLEAITPGPSHARIVTYRGLDPIDLPKIVFDVLYYFDGGPTVETLSRIRRATGVILESALVRRLVDFEILVPTP